MPIKSEIISELVDNDYIICPGIIEILKYLVNTILKLPDKRGVVIAGEGDRKNGSILRLIIFNLNLMYPTLNTEN